MLRLTVPGRLWLSLKPAGDERSVLGCGRGGGEGEGEGGARRQGGADLGVLCWFLGIAEPAFGGN
jgi:hypothetical protein